MDACTDNGKDIFGCGGIQIFAAIYTEIIWLLGSNDPGNLDLMCHEWDTETPTDDAPMVSPSSLSALQARKEWKGEGSTISPDHDHVRQNDDLLTQWFAEWAIVSLHRFRKFHIILSHPDSSDNHEECAKTIKAVERRWGHVEALTAEDCFKRHRVTDQTKLDEMEAERRKRARAELSGKKQAARQARAEEREAAKDALEERMRYLRDGGAGDGEVVEAGRRLLRGLGASEKEVRECRVDEERVFEFNYLKRLDAGGVVGTC